VSIQPDIAQDPDELFDILDEHGAPTGQVKRRADVHRDGDWHRAIHVWVWGVDDTGPYILLNQRGRNKDTWPLALDATVGGHLGAGETVEDAYREVEEELGIPVRPECLTYLGQRARESDGSIPGIIDREYQEIYLLRDNRPFLEFRPNPAELEGIVRLTLGTALALFAPNGDLREVNALRLRAEDHTFDRIQVTKDALLMLPGETYFLDVARAIHQRVNTENATALRGR
jgi:isopentenyldiphosphate isomerase